MQQRIDQCYFDSADYAVSLKILEASGKLPAIFRQVEQGLLFTLLIMYIVYNCLTVSRLFTADHLSSRLGKSRKRAAEKEGGIKGRQGSA